MAPLRNRPPLFVALAEEERPFDKLRANGLGTVQPNSVRPESVEGPPFFAWRWDQTAASFVPSVVARPLRSSLLQPTTQPPIAELTARMTTQYMIWR